MNKENYNTIKICPYCKKEFIITAEERKTALSKGGKIKRKYCRSCLKRWRKGEIVLENGN